MNFTFCHNNFNVLDLEKSLKFYTWLRDWDRPYNLGDNEFHLALEVDDFDKAYEHHKEMGCICFENKAMGIYFISDPDNYWIEILPANRG